MTIKQKKEGKRTIVYINGRIDTSTAPELLEYLKTEMAGVEELELDLSNVDYISSAGLRVILAARKHINNQGEMSIINVNETVLDVLTMTGFDKILKIEAK